MACAQPGGGAGGFGAFQIEDHDAGAVRGHLSGGGEAQAVESGAAGDDGNLVLEQHLFDLLMNGWGSNAGAGRARPASTCVRVCGIFGACTR